MRDDDIETVLKRYRPVGPDPGLRGRILARAAPRRAWPWAAAAAALLAATAGFHAATARLQGLPTATPNEQARAAAVDELTIGLGGDAREVAERLIAEQALGRELDAARTPAAGPWEVR